MKRLFYFVTEQELDEQESLCGECGNVHSCTTACYYDDDDGWEQEAWKAENYERERNARR